MFLLLLITSALACLQHSRNLEATFLPSLAHEAGGIEGSQGAAFCMVNGAIARRRRGGRPRAEAEEEALNDSLGIHKFLPALLSSCVLSPLALSVRLDAKIAPLLGRVGLKMLHERTRT